MYRSLDEYLGANSEEVGDCILWVRAKVRGYGVCYGTKWARIHGKSKAHQLAYINAVGPIPPGLCVCHSCDNPTCINPAHLFLGTVGDNNADRDRKGRHKASFGAAVLTLEQVEEIRSRKGRGTLRTVAADYGVSIATISRIWNNLTWQQR
jgi:hypothetical protein